MTRNVAQNTRPSFRFSGEGSGHETSPKKGASDKNSLPGEPGNEARNLGAVLSGHETN